MTIKENAKLLLEAMVDSNKSRFIGAELAIQTGFKPKELNLALDYLQELDAVELVKTFGTEPYDFAEVWLKPKGNFLNEEYKDNSAWLKLRMNYEKALSDMSAVKKNDEALKASYQDMLENFLKSSSFPERPIVPQDSPYGFTDYDWATVAANKKDKDSVYVVLGMQSLSEHYNSKELVANIEGYFQKAVAECDKSLGKKISLKFKALSAGLGGHLFNQIARDIIGSDITVFETSDFNSNVMIEMGVALTWGKAVLPLRNHLCKEPPSDISGQTWATYDDSGKVIVSDEAFESKLMEMVKRAVETK